jgi:hypothetical protein
VREHGRHVRAPLVHHAELLAPRVDVVVHV